MQVNRRAISKNRIPYKDTVRNANIQVNLEIFTKTPRTEEWMGSKLGRPTLVYDINGQPLFYDYPLITTRRKNVGLIRTSANRLLGESILSTIVGKAPWNWAEANRKVTEIIEKKHKGKVESLTPVCYAYPRLGVKAEWSEKGERRETIYDIADQSVVPPSVKPGIRGVGAISMYGQIQKEKTSELLEIHKERQSIHEELVRRVDFPLERSLKKYEYAELQKAYAVVLQFFTTKILTLCTHNYSHECFNLHGQENGYYCVPATGQMILDFWRYYYTQDQIAHAMGTTAGGTGWTGEVNGLNSLTCSHFTAQSDMSPTFNEVKTEINANRPFDYSYSYHAMACAGYKEQNWYIIGTTPLRQVYIYDPSPVNSGAIRWETWGSGISAVAGFVYLRR
jgi:hypothetical protein